jgi:hypothetical protein
VVIRKEESRQKDMIDWWSHKTCPLVRERKIGRISARIEAEKLTEECRGVGWGWNQ